MDSLYPTLKKHLLQPSSLLGASRSRHGRIFRVVVDFVIANARLQMQAFFLKKIKPKRSQTQANARLR